VVRDIQGNDHIEGVVLQNNPAEDEGQQVTIECDALLLQLGFVTKLGPLKEWGFQIQKGSLLVDPLMKTNLPLVWACGDIATFDGKLKLIATGFSEAAIAVAQAVHTLRPEMKIQPAYSTNTGVPGLIAGQA
jgi:thioredoxin reductase (NADPH)